MENQTQDDGLIVVNYIKNLFIHEVSKMVLNHDDPTRYKQTFLLIMENILLKIKNDPNDLQSTKLNDSTFAELKGVIDYFYNNPL